MPGKEEDLLGAQLKRQPSALASAEDQDGLFCWSHFLFLSGQPAVFTAPSSLLALTLVFFFSKGTFSITSAPHLLILNPSIVNRAGRGQGLASRQGPKQLFPGQKFMSSRLTEVPAPATPPIIFCRQSPPADMATAFPCPGRPQDTHWQSWHGFQPSPNPIYPLLGWK